MIYFYYHNLHLQHINEAFRCVTSVLKHTV